MMADKMLAFTKNDTAIPKSDLEDLVKTCLGAVSLLGFANREFSLRRRELIRPALKSQFGSLCGESTPITPEWLFGDDIHATLKKVKQAEQVGKEATQSGHFLSKGGFRNSRYKDQSKRRHAKGNNGSNTQSNWQRGKKDSRK